MSGGASVRCADILSAEFSATKVSGLKAQPLSPHPPLLVFENENTHPKAMNPREEHPQNNQPHAAADETANSPANATPANDTATNATPTHQRTIIIAPDSLKGTATAQEAAQALADGVRSVLADAEIILAPMADGGEGTAATFQGQEITLPTVDAMGRLCEASYILDGTTAYIDIAAASGLPAVMPGNDPATADTYGTGVLIADAQTRGAQRIVLGLGGSATVDGGTGILIALGATPMDQAGHPLKKGGVALKDIASIDTAQLNIPAAAMEWVLLSDVTSPATGPDGAAAVFGPQKGADEETVAALDAGIEALLQATGVDGSIPGMGAAGATPVSLMWLSTLLHGSADRIHLMPGAPLIARTQGLEEAIPKADLVITAEGRLDEQSFRGKVVGTLWHLAKTAGTPFAVAAGQLGELPDGVHGVQLKDSSDVYEQLFDAGQRIAMSTVQG